jgi:hypothetical protein
MATLDIKVIPFGDNADLIINGKYYFVETARLKDFEDLRNLVHDQPEYVFNALVGLLQGMASCTSFNL